MTDQKFEDIAKRENRDLESTETKLAITNGILLLPRDNNEFIYTEILKLLDSPEYKTLREKIYIDRNLDGVSTHMIEGSERNLYSNF